MSKYFKINKIKFNNNFTNKLSYMKYLFLLILILSTLLMINSSSWYNAWMMMEINLLSFIPIMLHKSKKNKSSNPMMMYFFVQTSSSSWFIMMLIISNLETNLIKINIIFTVIQLSLLMKLGASPFHWWMPKILPNLSWMNCFILFTWQKIGPLILLESLNVNSMTYLSSILSIYFGAILGMNQTSIKLIMAYSSINHLGWILMSLMIETSMLIIYLIVYSSINLMICLMMNSLNFNNLNNLFKNKSNNVNEMLMMSLFLSLSGMPPLLGFLPKFMLLLMMIKNSLLIETLFFILMSVISLSFYFNPLMSMLFFSKFNLKFNYKNFFFNKTLSSILMINLSLSLFVSSHLMNLL
uniref:NADH-ubiquinone oxidoreductase chain 2 n=1 Tax=Conaspidia wangi TaxID=2675281 RepID=A0A8E5FHP8_9HYME|nr:NADH dehydrogenase subunit 2 [Conaspidia wangi]QSZ78250.1 NADH dehydrogenase subunit 2 [Conaspidia wangi]